MIASDNLTRIPHKDNETIRAFFERYRTICPNGRSVPFRIEFKHYYPHFTALMIPWTDGSCVLDAVTWCLENIVINDWYNVGVSFFFTHESDAVMFKLRFSTIDWQY